MGADDYYSKKYVVIIIRIWGGIKENIWRYGDIISNDLLIQSKLIISRRSKLVGDGAHTGNSDHSGAHVLLILLAVEVQQQFLFVRDATSEEPP